MFTYDKDSILVISKYTNGKLDGDSAYSRYYKNGLCKSTAKYDNGNLIDYKEFEYFGILPKVGGLNGGYVERNWMINQDSVNVGLIKLNKHLIDNTPIDFIVVRADFDISNYNIVNFSLTGGCIGGLLIDYRARSNKITDSMKKSFKDAPHKDYYFYAINCRLENDTIELPKMHFKLR